MPEDIVERLTDWTSRHSNVTPLDGTDRDSPTFGDLRALLSALKEREERLARYSKPPKVYFTASIGTTELTLIVAGLLAWWLVGALA